MRHFVVTCYKQTEKKVASVARYAEWCECPSWGEKIESNKGERCWVGAPTPHGTACDEIKCPKCGNRMVPAG
jgi:hypothetical protein